MMNNSNHRSVDFTVEYQFLENSGSELPNLTYRFRSYGPTWQKWPVQISTLSCYCIFLLVIPWKNRFERRREKFLDPGTIRILNQVQLHPKRGCRLTAPLGSYQQPLFDVNYHANHTCLIQILHLHRAIYITPNNGSISFECRMSD